ncbi:MAG: phytanoyl-CoA dioxygenase family protein [Phycisphaeraceae bacterium]
MPMVISETQWQQYQRDGYLKLGRLLDDEQLAAMRQRIDDIMLGKANTNYDRMLMQLDSEDGAYGSAGEQSRGHKGATLGYRKIQDLEFDPLFLRFMQRPIFEEICAHEYGAEAAIACYRAMFMNKPAHKGTFLPWHQDRWTSLDHDPLVTIWLALDPATVANGCVQLVPGTHHALVNKEHASGFLTKEQAAELCTPEKRMYLELAAGEAALLHNWTLHGSDVNRTDSSRRAFSVCYMDAGTVARNGETFSRIFGPGALTPQDAMSSVA